MKPTSPRHDAHPVAAIVSQIAGFRLNVIGHLRHFQFDPPSGFTRNQSHPVTVDPQYLRLFVSTSLLLCFLASPSSSPAILPAPCVASSQSFLFFLPSPPPNKNHPHPSPAKSTPTAPAPPNPTKPTPSTSPPPTPPQESGP